MHTYSTRVVVISSIILFVITVSSTLLFFFLQFTQRSQQMAAYEYATLLRNNISRSSSLGSTAYSYEKLKQLMTFIQDAPEFVEQYNYMINTVIAENNVEIELLSFDEKLGAKFTFSSDDINELYAVIDRLEKESRGNTFESVTIDSITATRKKNSKDMTYSVVTALQFKKGFNAVTE